MNLLTDMKSMIKILLLLAAAAFAGEPNAIPLWPDGAPGSEGKTAKEVVAGPAGARRVSSIHNPSLTPYLPPKDKATGIAVIVIPGGGHPFLATVLPRRP